MWSFLFALIVGSYWLIRLVIDKGETEACNKSLNSALDDWRLFAERYAMWPIECDRIEKEKLWSPECDGLRKELEEVTGIYPTPHMMLWGYLAKQGKVPHAHIFGGYDPRNVLDAAHDRHYHELPQWRDKYSPPQMHDARLKFLKWLDAELRANGMEHQLMYVTSNGDRLNNGDLIYYYKDRKPISGCTDASYRTVFFWEPTRVKVRNLQGSI